jgi:hypothetical protein
MAMQAPQQAAQKPQNQQSLYDFMKAYNQALGNENRALTMDQLMSMFNTNIK